MCDILLLAVHTGMIATALRRILPISVQISFDMNFMKDSCSFINRGQADTSDVVVPQKRHCMGSFCCGTKVHSLATMRAEWKHDLLWPIVHIFDIFIAGCISFNFAKSASLSTFSVHAVS